MPTPAPRPPGSKRGFALLLTLTLLAFVVLLLVGLATYTRVETAIAGNMQQQAQARENALLALNVALGQLQRHAGPDTRVTATATALAGVDPQKRFYTGVWDSDVNGSGPTTAPLVWLASGPEAGAVDVTSAIAADRRVMLVGSKTDGSATANATMAELQEIRAPGVPGGAATGTLIGKYAWWVGDQGVKAPVAVNASTEAIDYAPFVDGTSTDLRTRIQQQIGLGAGAATATGEPAFEIRDANNAALAAGERVFATNQLAFVRNPDNATLGLATLRQNYHAWAPNNFAVLADTRRGGLKQDLSLRPDLLGGAFSAWARYERPRAVNMEPPVAATADTPSAAPAPLPAYSTTDPLRRRYFITASDSSGGIEAGVHPVLSFFGLSFSIRVGGSSNYEVGSECVVGFWNPFTSALVPPGLDGQPLNIRITGLPTVLLRETPGGAETPINLQEVMAGGQPLKFTLLWPEAPVREDEASWLPGRVYYWRTQANTSEPPDGNVMLFNERNTNGQIGIVRQTQVPGTITSGGANVYRQCSVRNGDATVLRVELYRGSNPTPLATFESPAFFDFETPAEVLETAHHSNDFAFVFRLPDPAEIPDGETQPWLSSPSRDPRLVTLPGTAFVGGNNGTRPELYGGHGIAWIEAEFPSRLLDRPTDAHSFNEDVPVFELPRAPVLTLGMLQHLAIPGARPFSIGNPWGTSVQLSGMGANELFDRYFFSGLSAEVTATETQTGQLALPNPFLRSIRKPDGTRVTFDDVRHSARDFVVPDEEPPPDGTQTSPTTSGESQSTVIPGTGRSSRFFLHAGSFNVNSVQERAWAAVLRNVRFPEPQSFAYLDASVETGTAEDTARATVQSSDAQFFRFPQSAQETYKAEPGFSAPSEDGVTPPNTHLYRRGMRTLSATQVAALAGKIAELVRLKHASTDETLGGPFRSMEEFLSPSSLFAGVDTQGNASAPRSLLEAAIADTGINVDEAGNPIEFSSQFLTQADIMTALAPFLSPRSDTFVIRTHGQAINPATGAVEGRAWCEATVQRLPEYFDPADDAAVLPVDLTSELNKLHGRRFKVVSFRWLTLADI